MSYFFKKSQASLEFLMIFGIGFTIIVILGGIFFNYSNGAKHSLDEKQITNIGNQLISNIEKIYYLGEGNRITLTTKFPDGIKNITIVHANNITLSTGAKTSFDYLNISYYGNRKIISNIFTTNQNYIRFNCSECYHNLSSNVSYYSDSSDFTGGIKKIKIESKGSWVSVDFVKS